MNRPGARVPDPTERINAAITDGWSRWLPHGALQLLGAIAASEEAGITGDLDEVDEGPIGWLVSARGGVEHRNGVDPEEVSDRGARPDDLELVRRGDAIARRLGMTPLRSLADDARFLIRCGLVERTDDGETIQWRVAWPVPLPEERLPLTPQERAQEDRIRWSALHHHATIAVVTWLTEHRHSEVTTTLAQVAAACRLDVESARQALIDSADFDWDTTADLTRAEPTQPLTLIWAPVEAIELDAVDAGSGVARTITVAELADTIGADVADVRRALHRLIRAGRMSVTPDPGSVRVDQPLQVIYWADGPGPSAVRPDR